MKILFLIVALNFPLFVLAEESKIPSQAYNASTFSDVNINAATGSVVYKYPVIQFEGVLQPFKLNLMFAENDKGMFGFSKGWSFDLDYIDNQVAHINGKTWQIDNTWHDCHGHASGLKYLNHHGTEFHDHTTLRPIPGASELYYRYSVSFKDGVIKYFSDQGLLLVSRDRFGNQVKFNYTAPVSSLYDVKITKVTDNYGNQYHFNYEPGAIRILYPDGRQVIIYSKAGFVKTIVDVRGQKTKIAPIDYLGSRLIKTIETPEGLFSTITYSQLPVKWQNKDGFIPVATELVQYDKSTDQLHRKMIYQYTSTANFTGYPNYKISKGKDSLIESKDGSFRYGVTVTQVDNSGEQPVIQVKEFQYNYLHMPVKVILRKEGKPFSVSEHTYDISPFYAYRSVNYDKPIASRDSLWNESKKDFISHKLTEYKYDNYGNLLHEIWSSYDQVKGEWKKMHTAQHEYFTDSFSLKKKSHLIDHLSGVEKKEVYSLNKSKNNHKKRKRLFKSSDQAEFVQWDEARLTHDDKGRNTSMQLKDLMNQQLPKTIVKKKRYLFDQATGLLTVEQEDDLKAVKRRVYNTKNGSCVKSIKPMGQETQYHYDEANRLSQVVSPSGRVKSYSYLVFQEHGRNAVVNKSPMGRLHRFTQDGAQRITLIEDMYQGAYRRLHEVKRNAFGKEVSSIDLLGRKSSITYDDQLRPIRRTDVHGNITSILYDDDHNETTLYQNGQLIFRRKSTPWELQSADTLYPFGRNVDFKSDSYFTHTRRKDASGNILQINQALRSLSDHTLKSSKDISYSFDMKDNVSQLTIRGNDGIKRTINYDYDMLGNKTGSVMTYTSGNKTSTHVGYRYSYDVESRLIEEEAPGGDDSANRKTFYQYNLNGELAKKLSRNGQAVHYRYDSDSRLIQQSWLRDGSLFEVKSDYDLDDRKIQSVDSSGARQRYFYDEAGRLMELVFDNGQYDQQYTYDEFDRVIEFKTPQVTQHYEYGKEGNGDLTDLYVDKDSYHMSYGADENGTLGSRLSMTHAHSGNPSYVKQFNYDAFSYLAKTTTSSESNNFSYQVDYQRNALGDIDSYSEQLIKEGKHAFSKKLHYNYDSLRRLTKAVSASGHVDLAEVMSTTDYVYDGNNNLVLETHQTGDQVNQISRQYNAENLLISVLDNKATCLLKYDESGRLSKDCQGREFNFDGNDFLFSAKTAEGNPIAFTYHPDGTLRSRSKKGEHDYFFSDAKKKIVDVQRQGEWSRLVRDNQSILASIDVNDTIDMFKVNHTSNLYSNQRHVDKVDYSAYGDRIGAEIEHIWQSFGWNQEYNDPDLSLVYLVNRFHHIENRQFISVDPVRLMNRRAYAKGNPISFIDPLGVSPDQALNYSLGVGLIVTSVFAAIGAAPTGGASLTLMPAVGIGSGVLGSLSGLSIVGSQLAHDLGNDSVADVLKIAAVTTGVAAALGGVFYLAPKVYDVLLGLQVVRTTSHGITRIMANELTAGPRMYGASEGAFGSQESFQNPFLNIMNKSEVMSSRETLPPVARSASQTSLASQQTSASQVTVVRKIAATGLASSPAQAEYYVPEKTSEAIIRLTPSSPSRLAPVSLQTFTGEASEATEMSLLMQPAQTPSQLAGGTESLNVFDASNGILESDML